jgi:nucleoside 2-deoxyribosyltransferase
MKTRHPPLRSAERQIVAFVAMSFREEEKPALVGYYRAIKRAVEGVSLPIELRRIDFVDGDYEISQQIMDEIDQAEIVITDFTLSARNVYFELGYARGKQKRIIQTARKETTLEFDVRNWRTMFYRNATELEEKLVPELRAAYNDVVSAAR